MDAPAVKTAAVSLSVDGDDLGAKTGTFPIVIPDLPHILCVVVFKNYANDDHAFSYELHWADRQNAPLFYTCDAVVYRDDETVSVWRNKVTGPRGAPVSSADIDPNEVGQFDGVATTLRLSLKFEFDLYKSRTRAAPTSTAELAMLKEGTFSDVVVVCGERAFNCHKAILASRSEVFKTMLTGPFKEANENRIELKDMTEDIAEVFVKSVYVNAVVEDSVTWALFEATKMYDLPKLTSACIDILGKNLGVDNCCETLLQAHKHGLDNLFDYALIFVKRNLTEVASTDGWKGITRGDDFLAKVLLAALK